MISKVLLAIFLIILILLITLSRLLITRNFFILIKEHFSNDIFVERETGYNNFINSIYFKELNKNNLRARGVNNLKDYNNILKDNIIEFNENEKEEINELIKILDEKTKDLNKFNKIEWKLSKTTYKIENGFPFTIGSIIYVSDRFLERGKKYKLRTLLHEKVHLYQRKYPVKTIKFYEKYNFYKVKKIEDKMRRHNPDLDNFDYSYKEIRFYKRFNNSLNDLNDSYNNYIPENEKIKNEMKDKNYNDEHPNEIFANIISRELLNDKIEEYEEGEDEKKIDDRITKYLN